jgi:hypothetical protein
LNALGQELSIGPAGRRDRATTSLPRPVSRVAWREQRPAIDVSVEPVAAIAALQSVHPILDVSFSPHPTDAEEVITTLHAERAASRRGFNHSHPPSGCQFCRRSAAAYR